MKAILVDVYPAEVETLFLGVVASDEGHIIDVKVDKVSPVEFL